jgi:hypothetical protein
MTYQTTHYTCCLLSRPKWRVNVWNDQSYHNNVPPHIRRDWAWADLTPALVRLRLTFFSFVPNFLCVPDYKLQFRAPIPIPSTRILFADYRNCICIPAFPVPTPRPSPPPPIPRRPPLPVRIRCPVTLPPGSLGIPSDHKPYHQYQLLLWFDLCVHLGDLSGGIRWNDMILDSSLRWQIGAD